MKIVKWEGGIHSGGARTNEDSTEGRGNVLGHGAEVRNGGRIGRGGGGLANFVRTQLQSKS